jgi:hypothetical protein
MIKPFPSPAAMRKIAEAQKIKNIQSTYRDIRNKSIKAIYSAASRGKDNIKMVVNSTDSCIIKAYGMLAKDLKEVGYHIEFIWYVNHQGLADFVIYWDKCDF